MSHQKVACDQCGRAGNLVGQNADGNATFGRLCRMLGKTSQSPIASRTSHLTVALTNPDTCNDRDTMTRGIGLKRRSIFSDDEGDRQQRRKFVAYVAQCIDFSTRC